MSPATIKPSADAASTVTATCKVTIYAAGFHSLPYELRQTIIDLACSMPQTKSHHWLRPRYDLGLLLNLSLVSRGLNQQMQPYLFHQVCITRPSSLYALQQVLQLHPERAQLVKHLHVGPQSPLPLDWWPLSDVKEKGKGGKVQSHLVICASLEEASLSSRCESKHKFPLHQATRGCRGAAIYDALQAAQQHLGIDLQEEGKISGPHRIELVYMVQAALDLYLQRVRAVEVADPSLVKLTRPGARVPAKCRNGKCDHYPALVIRNSAPTANSQPTPPGAFVLTRTQLFRHLARRGSSTDRFDHPLMLARSGYAVSVIVPPERKETEEDAFRSVERGPRYETRTVKWDLLKEKDWAELAALREEDERKSSQGQNAALNASLIATSTIASNLRLVHSILSLTTSLANLSLSNFLERAIGSTHSLLDSAVKRLSLGPPPPWWYFDIDPKGLEGVEELRIGGTALSESEVNDLVKNFYNLGRLEWSMGEPWKVEHRWALIETLHHLTTSPLPSPPSKLADADWETKLAWASFAGKECRAGRPVPSGLRERTTKHSGHGQPMVLAWLDVSDVASMLGTAKDKETQDKWLKGEKVEGQARRLRLLAKGLDCGGDEEEGKGGVQPSMDCSSDFWAWMYQEGRDWWLKGGGGGWGGEGGVSERAGGGSTANGK